MKVIELIEKLQQLPKDAEVFVLWDGEARTEVQLTWLAKGGHVMLSDYNEVCYDNQNRPIDAPNTKENKYWQTIDDPTSNIEHDDEN
jgi:hypothetical protein